MELSKVTGTSSTCKFHLADGTTITASSEFMASPDGHFAGHYVHVSSMKHLETGEFLTATEKQKLKVEFERWRKARASKCIIKFVE